MCSSVWKNQKNTAEIENLKALLKLVGLRDLRDFRKANADKNSKKKFFEEFFLYRQNCFAEGFNCQNWKCREFNTLKISTALSGTRIIVVTSNSNWYKITKSWISFARAISLVLITPPMRLSLRE